VGIKIEVPFFYVFHGNTILCKFGKEVGERGIKMYPELPVIQENLVFHRQ
jgi:hypothetical protein